MSKYRHYHDTLAKFAGKNVGDSDRQQTNYVLAFTTLGNKIQIESFLFVSLGQGK